MKKRILIVDDSPLIHQIYGAQLEEAGYGVLHAEDGMSAINTTFTEMPDLILLDIQMPKINGYQVCRLLKDHPATKLIPILIATTQTSPSKLVSNPKNWSFETGADAFIDKEADSDLLGTIEPLLKKFPRSSEKVQKTNPMSEMEILLALSKLLDKQLYTDVTRLKELDERKNAFVANVSHEFKSPLAVLKTSQENILQGIYGPVTEQQKRCLEIINNTVNRLGRLVTDLLDLAKIESGKMPLKKEPICMSDLAQEVLETYSSMIEEKKMKVKTDFRDGVPAFKGDKDRLMQALINIFNNSLKFTPDGGEIIIRVFQEDNSVRLEIEDNGPGMSAEGIHKIFDKFERITTEKREGTGLGLPIAKDMVALHGGKVWAESEEGKGSKFIVVLPAGEPRRVRPTRLGKL